MQAVEKPVEGFHRGGQLLSACLRFIPGVSENCRCSNLIESWDYRFAGLTMAKLQMELQGRRDELQRTLQWREVRACKDSLFSGIWGPNTQCLPPERLFMDDGNQFYSRSRVARLLLN